ncbi:MAG: hypothetical protein IKA74_06690 [Clostridia bacterium]|nr:hypothetical protein [Clostridia bacterium]
MKSIESRVLSGISRVRRGVERACDTVISDIKAAKKNTGACAIGVVAFDRGFQALFAHRISYKLNKNGYTAAADTVSHIAKYCTGIELSPSARIEQGVYIDAGSSLRVAENAFIARGSVIRVKANAVSGEACEECEIDTAKRIDELEARVAELEKKRKRVK